MSFPNAFAIIAGMRILFCCCQGACDWGSSRQKITASCQRAKPLRAMGQHQSHRQETHLLVKRLAVWPPKPSESVGFKNGDGHVNSAESLALQWVEMFLLKGEYEKEGVKLFLVGSGTSGALNSI